MSAPEMNSPSDQPPAPTERPSTRKLQQRIIVGIALVLLIIIGLFWRATARSNHVALSDAPKPVTVERAAETSFRPSRSYVGTTDAWNAAKVGPQYVSAYVGTVLVRPGAVVKRGQVLATLDCRNASAASREISARARAIEERQAAVQHETERTRELKQGGFASENEVEQLSARSASEKAEVESLRASLVSRSLEVDDCILRAPFDGEVTDRFVDPGAYLRPGSPVVTVIDRTTVRISADAPETDFSVVAPETPVEIQIAAIGAQLAGRISRRAPAADEITRTVHFEIDVANPKLTVPAGATAQIVIHVGDPQPALAISLRSAVLRGDQASVFTIVDGKAKRMVVPVLGEETGKLFVAKELGGGAAVVVEGRSLLGDGDHVSAKEASQ
jgi:RND family efflux transporter MFP subunit